MVVVHFAKVSTLYSRVVILSLAKWLEKPPFCHSYTSFGVRPRDHYMPLQRFTMGCTPNSHSSEQGTLPTASLISKQVIPYRTRGGTYCPRVSTTMTRSLADLSMTNHITWRIPTVSTIPSLAQTTSSNLTTATSHHDRWKTNTLNTQHKSNSTS